MNNKSIIGFSQVYKNINNVMNIEKRQYLPLLLVTDMDSLATLNLCSRKEETIIIEHSVLSQNGIIISLGQN